MKKLVASFLVADVVVVVVVVVSGPKERHRQTVNSQLLHSNGGQTDTKAAN